MDQVRRDDFGIRADPWLFFASTRIHPISCCKINGFNACDY